jgi:hypothetical protein
LKLPRRAAASKARKALSGGRERCIRVSFSTECWLDYSFESQDCKRYININTR